jgi:hypothetical protein
MFTSYPSTPPFDGLDKMLLLAWVKDCLAATNYWKFALNYWDLRAPNVLFDKNLNIAGYLFLHPKLMSV